MTAIWANHARNRRRSTINDGEWMYNLKDLQAEHEKAQLRADQIKKEIEDKKNIEEHIGKQHHGFIGEKGDDYPYFSHATGSGLHPEDLSLHKHIVPQAHELSKSVSRNREFGASITPKV